jgi:hypothetical protein
MSLPARAWGMHAFWMSVMVVKGVLALSSPLRVAADNGSARNVTSCWTGGAYPRGGASSSTRCRNDSISCLLACLSLSFCSLERRGAGGRRRWAGCGAGFAMVKFESAL